MNIHSRLPSSTVNGPGNRAVLWHQGCFGLNCQNCWNPATHPFIGAGTEIPITDLSNWILNLDIDGVTFSGGEPMQQATDLWDLISELKVHKPNLSLGMYTGYTSKELISGNYLILSENGKNLSDRWKSYIWQDIQGSIDFAVMGRYNHLQRDTSRPLCSSKNQKLVLTSNRYKLSDFKPLEVEVHINEEALVTITGFPMEHI